MNAKITNLYDFNYFFQDQTFLILFSVIKILLSLFAIILVIILPYIYNKKFYYKYSLYFIAVFTLINFYNNYKYLGTFLYFQTLFIFFLMHSQFYNVIFRGILLIFVVLIYFIEKLPAKYDLEYLSNFDVSLENNLYVFLVIYGRDLLLYILLTLLHKLVFYFLPFGTLALDIIYPAQNPIIMRCKPTAAVIVTHLDVFMIRHGPFPTLSELRELSPALLAKSLSPIEKLGSKGIIDFRAAEKMRNYKDLLLQIDNFSQESFSKEIQTWARMWFFRELSVLESSKGPFPNKYAEYFTGGEVTLPIKYAFPLYLVGLQPEYKVYSPKNFHLCKMYDFKNLNFKSQGLSSAKLVAENVATVTQYYNNLNISSDSYEFQKNCEFFPEIEGNPGDCLVKLAKGEYVIDEVKSPLSFDRLEPSIAGANRQLKKVTDPLEVFLSKQVLINNATGLFTQQIVQDKAVGISG